MIRFDAVTKHYRGAPRAALDSVNLEIGAGEFVFLVGASGSGKSSLLRLMLREERPSKGEIHVLGQRLTTISTRKVPYFRRSLGVVFQDFRLLPNKTVHDNVAFTLQVIGKSRGFIQTTVPDVLETVGLAEKAQNYPNELSGGEQQRVAIARAVVNKPAILLADEPTGNLDPTTSDGIMAVLERINRAGTTVVMATHDVTIVDRLQKRVVELVGGRIIRDELEASYVTSSIPLPRRAEAQAAPQPGPEVPLWARRGGQAEEALQPAMPEPAARSAEERRPAAVPMTAATDAIAGWSSRPVPETPPRHDGPAEPSRFGAAEQTGPVRTGPTPAAAAWTGTTPAADPTTAGSTGAGPVEAGPPRAARWEPGQTVAAADGQAGPPPAASRPAEPDATGRTGTVPTRPGATGPVRPATGPTPVPADAPPIWFRSDTGPVLVPGEHAPWRAAPVAPPAGPAESGDSRALFFAAPVPAPVPAQRGWTPEAEPDDKPAEPVQAAAAPPAVPAFAAPASPPIATPSPVTRTAASPADMDDTGDPEGQLRRLGRHRTQPLPDHLDFVTGLGLRAARSDDEVGPSS